jgi:hypothetical protein
MAVRTIAAGGGNWNATATWIEGIVPILGDTVFAAVTSGQLTVNVACCLHIHKFYKLHKHINHECYFKRWW